MDDYKTLDIIKINYLEKYETIPEFKFVLLGYENNEYNFATSRDSDPWFKENFKSLDAVNNYLSKDEYKKVFQYNILR